MAPVLFMGLNQVRELTRRTQSRILRHRPFTSFMDFLARADPRPQEAENLVRSGALEGFGAIPALLRQLESGGWRGGQLPLFALDSPRRRGLDSGRESRCPGRAAGRQPGGPPAGAGRPPRSPPPAPSPLSKPLPGSSQRVRVAGMRQTWRRSRTTAGDYIYFMALEDLEGMLDVVILGRGLPPQPCSPSPVPDLTCWKGMVEFDQEKGEPFIRLERAWTVGE